MVLLPTVTVAFVDVIPILNETGSVYRWSRKSGVLTQVERELDPPYLRGGEGELCAHWASRRLRRR